MPPPHVTEIPTAEEVEAKAAAVVVGDLPLKSRNTDSTITSACIAEKEDIRPSNVLPYQTDALEI